MLILLIKLYLKNPKPHELTASMKNIGYYIPLEKAIFEFRPYERMYYTWERNSFALWLIEKYGIEKYIQLYKSIINTPKLQVFKIIYGEDLKSLEEKWLNYLDEKYSHLKYTELSLAVLLVENVTIIYDDKEPLLRNVAENIRDLAVNYRRILKGMKAYTRPPMFPYSKIGNLEKMLENQNLVTIATVNSTLFRESISTLKIPLIRLCRAGFMFLNSCCTSANDSLVLIAYSKYGGKIGIIVGNSVESVLKLAGRYGKPPMHPLARGILCVNGSEFMILPNQLLEEWQIEYEKFIPLWFVIVFAIMALTIILYIRKHLGSHATN